MPEWKMGSSLQFDRINEAIGVNISNDTVILIIILNSDTETYSSTRYKYPRNDNDGNMER